MLKHGIIADASYFDRLLQALPSLATNGSRAPEFAGLIAGSVHIKADIVAEDTREGGLRQILNFGHTIAHAIEKLRNYAMLHGEAVAIGMVAEARIAEAVGVARDGVALAVADAVRRAGLPTTVPADLSIAAIVAETHGDKKARRGAARYALPRGIGEMDPAEGRWSLPVEDEIVTGCLSSLR
jgi:3-dehydroquinate synthase